MAKGIKTGGRKKGIPNKNVAPIKQLAQPYGEEALQVLVKTMRYGENESLRNNAAEKILDRAYGKAAQATEISGIDGNPIAFSGKIEIIHVKPK